MSNTLKSRAEQILRDNDRGRHTVPSARLYPHQWAWDSGFAAIGWAHFDMERAYLEVESILDGQWEDGRVPHIQFREPQPGYFPGPEIWGNPDSSTISNPPVWTLAAERILELGGDPERVRSWLPSLERSHQFLLSERDPLGWNCIATCHPWENGQDNCPAWDLPLESVDPEEAPPFQRVDKHKVEDAGQRPTETQYKRYIALVRRFAQNGFKLANFMVYDPFFTTLVILAEEALHRISQRLGMESEAGVRAHTLRHGLCGKLWSRDLGRYLYYDAHNKRFLDAYTSGVLAPVLLGHSTPGYQRMLDSLQVDFKTAYGLPTVYPESEFFDPICYWRGPSWVNMNWFFSRVLGPEIVESTLKMVEENGFWEYFHPRTGKGLGADHFTWTAALVLDMLAVKESLENRGGVN